MTIYPVEKPEKRPVRSPRKQIARRNKKRHSKNWLRSYGSVERVEFVKGLPCVVGAAICPFFQSENAHIEAGGAGRKSDAAKIVPLCAPHHREIHAVGRVLFEQFNGIDLNKAAAETEAAWVSSNLRDFHKEEE